jgi:putative transcription factor
MSTQDWKPVIFNTHNTRSKSLGLTTETPGEYSKRKNTSNPTTSSGLDVQALANDTETLGHVKITHSLKTAIMQGRCSKNINRADLANLCGCSEKTIASYENGTAIPDNAFIALMEKKLGCKLPRKDKKKK